jgi:hypothetical protein
MRLLLSILSSAALGSSSFLLVHSGRITHLLEPNPQCTMELLLLPGQMVPPQDKAQSPKGLLSWGSIGRDNHKRQHTGYGNCYHSQPGLSPPPLRQYGTSMVLR